MSAGSDEQYRNYMSEQREAAEDTRVYGFDDDHRFLSNYYPSPITVDGISYPTVEHAFAAAKTLDPEQRARIAALPTPGQAKRAGRTLALRSDWETVKTDVMRDLVREKFSAHPDLAKKLIATRDLDLIEANTWNDRVWGVDRTTGEGENRLGNILMQVREERTRDVSIGKPAEISIVPPRIAEAMRDGWEGVVERFDDLRPAISNALSSIEEIGDDAIEFAKYVGGVLKTGDLFHSEFEPKTKSTDARSLSKPGGDASQIEAGNDIEHVSSRGATVNASMQSRDGRQTALSDADRAWINGSPRFYAGVGSRNIHPHSDEARLARAIANRLEKVGYTLRSGAADGADFAFELGVFDAKHKQIFRPNYVGENGETRNPRLPKGYVIVRGEAEQRAATIADACTESYDRMDEFSKALHNRNAFQVLGPNLDQPVDFVLAIPSTDPRIRGTRATMKIAESSNIPVYDLTNATERAAFLDRLRDIERAAGITYEGPELAKPFGALRPTFDLEVQGDRSKPIPIRVTDIRTLESHVKRGGALPNDAIYIGRSVERASEINLPIAGMGNQFQVGVNGIQGACAEKFALALGNELENGNKEWNDRLAMTAARAVNEGSLNLVCHCAPFPCHGEAIAVAVSERLNDLGYATDLSALNVERIDRLRKPDALELEAKAALEAQGLKPRSLERVPWRNYGGKVLAENERDTFIGLGDGSYRRVATARLPERAARGQAISLVQTPDGRLDRARERAGRQTSVTL